MTDKEKLQIFVDFAPFLGKVLGNGCEVVVHDAKDYDHSLIYIENSLSGRDVGDPMTELARNILDNYKDSDVNYLADYIGYAGKTEFLDYTYFIRNEGRIIGFLCINKSMDTVKEAQHAIAQLMKTFKLALPEESDYAETLGGLVDDVMRDRIAKTIDQTGILPTRMSQEERMQVIASLRESGVLTMKGAVAELAKQLGISVPTVYRYMKKIGD